MYSANLYKHLLIFISLKQKVLPDLWKYYKICPGHKSGQINEIINYRPITILSNFAKEFEMCVYNIKISIICNSTDLYQEVDCYQLKCVSLTEYTMHFDYNSNTYKYQWPNAYFFIIEKRSNLLFIKYTTKKTYLPWIAQIYFDFWFTSITNYISFDYAAYIGFKYFWFWNMKKKIPAREICSLENLEHTLAPI